MDNISERIRIVRKRLGLTQAQFGEAVGVKGNTVTNYESGLRVPTQAIVKSICREFDVSEEWLLNGQGEMFVSLTPDEQLAEFFADMLKVDERAARGDLAVKELITLLSKLSPAGREKLADIGEELVKAAKKEGEQE